MAYGPHLDQGLGWLHASCGVGDPSYHGLSTGTTSPPVANVVGMDMVHGTIATTFREAADASPFVRLASGTFVSIHGGWVASSCTTPRDWAWLPMSQERRDVRVIMLLWPAKA
jgi:hypothetical protein